VSKSNEQIRGIDREQPSGHIRILHASLHLLIPPIGMLEYKNLYSSLFRLLFIQTIETCFQRENTCHQFNSIDTDIHIVRQVNN
jgi:hypothetical protein